MSAHRNVRKGLLLLTTSLIAMAAVPARSLQAQQAGGQPPSLERRVHSFDVERPAATAYSLWNSGQNQGHQVWFRVLGGDALFQQRLQVYKEQAPPRAPDMLPPDSELIYETEGNNSSQWFFLGNESEFYTYYFDGDNRPGVDVSWSNSKAVRVRKTVYENGDLYEISFEDLNTLDDYNDLEIEVVLIRN